MRCLQITLLSKKKLRAIFDRETPGSRNWPWLPPQSALQANYMSGGGTLTGISLSRSADFVTSHYTYYLLWTWNGRWWSRECRGRWPTACTGTSLTYSARATSWRTTPSCLSTSRISPRTSSDSVSGPATTGSAVSPKQVRPYIARRFKYELLNIILTLSNSYTIFLIKTKDQIGRVKIIPTFN